jgi:predicted RNase H-like nuclease (RuvC/YqgF family)
VSDDLIKNERNAVMTLRTGVTRYAEHLREAMAHARKDLTAQHRRAEGAVEQRRNALQRAERELKQARAALAQCREDCGGLERQLAAASQCAAQSKQEFDKARRAAQILAQAQRELTSTMQGIESKVGEHSSVASSALADLEARLAELGGGNHLLQKGAAVAIGVATFAELINPVKDIGNALNAVGIQNPVSDPSYTDMVERHDEQALDYVVEQSHERRKDGRS